MVGRKERGLNDMGLNYRGLNESRFKEVKPFETELLIQPHSKTKRKLTDIDVH